MTEQALRQELIDTAREMNACGINRGTSGNLSVRLGDGFLVTPSGMPYSRLQPDALAWMDFDGHWQGPYAPSSEWRFHLDILKNRPEANAVMHTHATFATTLACLGMNIPAFHYMVAVAGGKDIRCAPYATFGTQALSEHALQALQDRKACLLANHGMIALETSLPRVLALAVEVEALCEQYWRALQIGTPTLLPDAEMDVILEKFKTYGQAVRASAPAGQP